MPNEFFIAPLTQTSLFKHKFLLEEEEHGNLFAICGRLCLALVCVLIF